MEVLKFRIPICDFSSGKFLRFETWSARQGCFSLPQSKIVSNDEVWKNEEQFTNQLDQKQQEIYAGDILLRKRSHGTGTSQDESYGVVYWRGLGWRVGRYRTCSCGCGQDILWSSGPGSLGDFNRATVVGNIHQTPELTKLCRGWVDLKHRGLVND